MLRSYIKMSSFSCIRIFIFWYLVAGINAGDKALIFNYEKNTLVNLPADLSKISQCDDWIFICPEKQKAGKFEEINSLYNEALYVKKVLDYRSDCSNIDIAICDKPYETSMAYSIGTEKFEFGYEMFYRLHTLRNKPPLPFSNYYPMKNYNKSASKRALKKNISKETKKRKNTNSSFLDGYYMEFLWIPLVKLSLKEYKKIHYVIYDIRKNNINPKPDCQDYSLGNEIMDVEDVNSLYSEGTQKKALEKLPLPTRAEDSDEIPEGVCTPEYNCLIKWPLLPPDQFRFGSDSPLKCSNVTTIPIWKSTLEKIMEKLDKYLYTLQRVTSQPLRIVAGVNGILTITRFFFYHREIILKEKNFEIEVPKIIYKIVKFRLNPCEEGKNCRFGVLIVIHNGPNRPTKADLICEDLSGDLGWEEIRYETWSDSGVQSKFIYVCELTYETMEEVGLVYTKDAKFERLSLTRFPIFNKDTNKIKFDDSIKGRVYDEMKRISNPDEKVELNSSLIIERPPIYDNFSSTHDENPAYYDSDVGEDYANPSDDDETSQNSDTDTENEM